MELTKKRMAECNAVFFYQLLLTIVDPKISGMHDDPHMGYYEEMAKNNNLYAF